MGLKRELPRIAAWIWRSDRNGSDVLAVGWSSTADGIVCSGTTADGCVCYRIRTISLPIDTSANWPTRKGATSAHSRRNSLDSRSRSALKTYYELSKFCFTCRIKSKFFVRSKTGKIVKKLVLFCLFGK